jgi:hypothetical protein
MNARLGSGLIGLWMLSFCGLAAWAQDCPVDAVPEIEGEILDDAERAYLDEFAAALGSFRGMTLEDFYAEYGPKKSYLEARSGRFRRGDGNADGALDLSDALCILDYLFLGSGSCRQPDCLDALDADDSGKIELTDAVGLLGHLFLGGAAPPAPHPEPGADPTADGFECGSSGALGYEPMEAEFLPEILNAFPLTLAQEDALRRHGFVICDGRRFDSFLTGFFEVFRNDLPVYISVDSILDALYLSMDRLIEELEDERLAAELEVMLSAMEGGLEGLRQYAGGSPMDAELDDLSTWLCVARSLLAGEKMTCARPVDEAVSAYLARALAADGIWRFPLFGADHCEDFSQFKVRGHYSKSERLSRYFRAMIWVQRVGFKFVQSPRHAAAAYLLSRLLEDTRAIESWRRIDGAIRALVGFSDSLNPPGMLDLSAQANMLTVGDFYAPEIYRGFVQTALRGGFGKQRINSQVLEVYPAEPGGFTPIPPAFHVLGQRFVLDSYVFTNVVHDRVPRRYMPSPLDAWFALGNRAALPLLRPELEAFRYHPQLAALEHLVRGYDEPLRGADGGGVGGSTSTTDFWSGSLYNSWLGALRTLHRDTTGIEYPPAMRTPEWDLRMLNAQLASYAHLKHATILYPKPSSGPGECEYPDGWVDPYPEFYERLADFASATRAGFEALGLARIDCEWRGGMDGGTCYWTALEETARQLAEIARAELQGLDLTSDQRRLLKTWLFERGHCGYWGPIGPEVPTFYDGAYSKLIFGLKISQGERFAPAVADLHTNTFFGTVLHVGVGHPNLMLMTVQSACGLRAYAGPVLSYYEFVAGGLRRWSDEEWQAALDAGDLPPRPRWTASFIR